MIPTVCAYRTFSVFPPHKQSVFVIDTPSSRSSENQTEQGSTPVR